MNDSINKIASDVIGCVIFAAVFFLVAWLI